ncbi:MAG: DUF503 domain-containing protein [Ktedonobacterales bacterium]
MFVGTCRLTLHLLTSQSLKDKRQVIRSLLPRLRNQFEVAAAEVGSQDLRQLAVLGLAYVSNNARHAEEVMQHAVGYIESTRLDCEITEVQIEVVSIDD